MNELSEKQTHEQPHASQKPVKQKRVKRRRIRKTIVRLFNFRVWSNYDRVKEDTIGLWDALRQLFKPKTSTVREEFNQVVGRLGLSDADLRKRHAALQRLAFLMLFVALSIFAYCIYLMTLGHWRAVLVSFVLTLLAGVFAFRYHFWAFQMQEKKLGCTVDEWFKYGLRGVKR